MESFDEFCTEQNSIIKQLESKFSTYGNGITMYDINQFLKQFDNNFGLGLKLLNNVDYYNETRLNELSRMLLNQLEKYITPSHTLFCPISVLNTGSTHRALDQLRRAYRNKHKSYKKQFGTLHNMFDMEKYEESEDKLDICFIDQFVGSGHNIAQCWEQVKQFSNDNHKYYVGCNIASNEGIELINSESDGILNVITPQPIPETNKIFNDDNATFTDPEKAILKEYCERVEPKQNMRYGYNNGQFLIVIYHKTPNNTIPILHKSHTEWVSLFPRTS